MTDQTDKNATEIWPDDADEGYRIDGTRSRRDHYNRLRNGNKPGRSELFQDRESRTKRDRSAVLDAIAGQLELTDYQKGRAKHLLTKIDDDHFRARRTAVVILALCGHVGREDGRDYHPHALHSEDNDFLRVANSINASFREVMKCWHAVGDEL